MRIRSATYSPKNSGSETLNLRVCRTAGTLHSGFMTFQWKVWLVQIQALGFQNSGFRYNISALREGCLAGSCQGAQKVG